MDYRIFGNNAVIRLDPGEDIHESLSAFAKKEGVRLASVSAIGAVDELTVGTFSLKTNQYDKNHFSGDLEVVSITGNITTMNGDVYTHLHICFADETGRLYGGHLIKGRISITSEMFLSIIDGAVDRAHNDEMNVNMLDFK